MQTVKVIHHSPSDLGGPGFAYYSDPAVAYHVGFSRYLDFCRDASNNDDFEEYEFPSILGVDVTEEAGTIYYCVEFDEDAVSDGMVQFSGYMPLPEFLDSLTESSADNWPDIFTGSGVRLTTNHAASSYGIPVFVGPGNTPVDYADGFRNLRKARGWTVSEIADRCGVSARTIEGWEQGRMPSTEALLRLMHTL